jgi:hypothetical protein
MFWRTQFRIACAGIALALLPLGAYSQESSPTATIEHGLDPRILAHYSSAEILEMQQHTPTKLAQLNYYYQSSWQLQAAPDCPACPMPDPATIDITTYEHMRQLDRPNTVRLTDSGHYLVLLPRNEVMAQYRQIR